MIRFKKSSVLLSMVLALVLILSACSSGNNNNSGNSGSNQQAGNTASPSASPTVEPEKDPDPVTLYVGWRQGDWNFETYMKTPIEAKFPHITLEKYDYQTHEVPAMEEAIARGEVGDIIEIPNIENAATLRERFGVVLPLDELIEKNNTDLSVIEPSYLQVMRDISGGEIITFPMNRAFGMLAYNKDVFDAFNVDYPTDNMTWPEVLELAAKVTGERDGVDYKGIGLAGWNQTSYIWMRTLPIIDENDKVNVENNPEIRRWLELAQSYLDLGITHSDPTKGPFAFGGSNFKTDRNVAMYATYFDVPGMAGNEGLNFDVVTHPVWPDNPEYGPTPYGTGMVINPHSEHIDEAYRVLEYIVSAEYQQMSAELWGRPSIGNDPILWDNFGAEVESLVNRKAEGIEYNILGALTKVKAHPAPQYRHPYLNHGLDFGTLMAEFAESKLDVPSFLRVLQERVEASVAEQLAQR